MERLYIVAMIESEAGWGSRLMKCYISSLRHWLYVM